MKSAPRPLSAPMLRLLVDSMAEVLWVRRLDPPSLLYVSPAFETVWNRELGEIHADPGLWWRSAHPDDRERAGAAFQAWLDGRAETYYEEYRIIDGGGKTRWLAERGIWLSRRDGKAWQAAGIARDITQRKADERGRARLAAVVESSEDAILTLDLDGVILTWNAGAEEVFGYRAEEVVGRPVALLRPPEAADDERVFRRRIQRGQRIQHYETRRRRKDGRVIDVSISISPLLDDTGALAGFSKISRDISPRKRAERSAQRLRRELERRVDARTRELREANEELRRAMQRERALQREILEISERERRRIGQDLHDDLGQQIAGAWMLAGVLESALAARGAAEHTDVARLGTLLQGALAVTRGIARGLHPVAAEEGGLDSALRDLAALGRDVFGLDCKFRRQGAARLENAEACGQLYRIAQEALSNAARHGAARKVWITLASGRDGWRLEVVDDGAGFDHAAALKSGGGMGLRIMAYRADMIGASLEISPRLPRGTRVFCQLPSGSSK